MTRLLPVFLKYLYAWVLMSSTLFGALIAESAYSYLRGDGRRSDKKFVPQLVHIFREARMPVTLPGTARIFPSLYGPAFAFAALLPICASIPFSTVVPILGNGGDLMQIFQFALLSDVLAIITIYSLGTDAGDASAGRFARGTLSLVTVVVACFASLAWYLGAADVEGDIFSLNVISQAMQSISFSPLVLAGIAIFVFLILGAVGAHDSDVGCVTFEDGELVEYCGPQRAILCLWAIFRTFIIVALITHIFFPWVLFKPASDVVQGISWRVQAFNFLTFWLMVIAVRVLIVPLCADVLGRVRSLLPARYSWLLLPCLTAVAAILVIYGAETLSAEVASF